MVAADDAAVASGVYSTGRYLGGIVAASLLAATAGSQDGFAVVLGICVVAALASSALALALPGRGLAAAPVRAGGA